MSEAPSVVDFLDDFLPKKPSPSVAGSYGGTANIKPSIAPNVVDFLDDFLPQKLKPVPTAYATDKVRAVTPSFANVAGMASSGRFEPPAPTINLQAPEPAVAPDVSATRAALELFPQTAGYGVVQPRMQPPAVDAMYENINQPQGGASSTARTLAPGAPLMPEGALPREAEEGMLGEIGAVGPIDNLASGILAAKAGLPAIPAKINRAAGHLAGLPFEVAGEVGQFLDKLDLGEGGLDQPSPGVALSATGDKFQQWIDSLTVPTMRAAEEEAANLAPSSRAGLGSKLIHGAVAGAPIMAAGMAATALGGPEAGAVLFGSSGAATTYNEAIDRGVPRSQAGAAAISRGILEGILAKGLPAEQTAGAIAVAAQQAAKAKAGFAPALHGAAMMTGFESLQQYGEVLTGKTVTPEESAERLASAALTGAMFHTADILKGTGRLLKGAGNVARDQFDLARLSTGLSGGTGREWQGPTSGRGVSLEAATKAAQETAEAEARHAHILAVKEQRAAGMKPGALTEVSNDPLNPTAAQTQASDSQGGQAEGAAPAQKVLTPGAGPTVTMEPKAPDALAPSLHTEGIAEALGNDAGDVVVPKDATPEQLREIIRQLQERTKKSEERRDVSEREARTDPLTGIANRRALDEALPAAEADPDMAVISFDANRFGLVNKKGGQELGDQALKDLAEALGNAAKEAGVPVRLFRRGGDEFVMLVPKALAEKVRLAAEKAYGTRKYAGVDVSISGSVGDTFGAADAKLQPAKKARKAEQALTEPVPEHLAARGPLSESYEVAREDFDVEPENYQYKITTGPGGVNETLLHEKEWKPEGAVTVWRDPKDGRLKLINGHQRIGLYDRLGEKIPIRVEEISHEAAATPEAAMVIGAMQNFRGGNGTAFDAAKLFRNLGAERVEALKGQPGMTRGIVRDGLALSKLDQGIFTAAATGKLPESQAIILGKELPDRPTEQWAVYKQISERAGSGKPMADYDVQTLARLAKHAGTFAGEGKQMTLGGEATETAGLGGVMDIYRSLERDFQAMRRESGALANEGVAERAKAEGAGEIDTKRGAELAQQATEISALMERFGYTGKYLGFAREAARRIASGENRETVLGETRSRFATELRGELRLNRDQPGAAQDESLLRQPDAGAEQGSHGRDRQGTEQSEPVDEAAAEEAKKRQQVIDQGQVDMFAEPAKAAEPEPEPEPTPRGLEFVSPDRKVRYILHKSTREPGRWQLTAVDDDGPVGHTTYDTRQAAIDSATGKFHEGVTPVGSKSYKAKAPSKAKAAKPAPAAEPGEPAEETYWKGDRVRFTGVTKDEAGAKWREAEIMEGHRKGDKVLIRDKREPGGGGTRADRADSDVGTTLEDRQVLYDKTWAEKLPPEIKAQLREMAKLMHPDKARTEAEKVRHTAFMSLTNDAADRGNIGHMKAILEAWHRGDEVPPSPADYRAGRAGAPPKPPPPPPPPKQPGAPPPPKQPRQPPPPREPSGKPPPPPVRPSRRVDTEPGKLALELPELVELAENIAKGHGDPLYARIVAKMQRGVRGTFNDLTKEIRISADLFRDPVQVAKTLAHEIGHYIDSIPGNLSRGNILGSIASLFKYGKSLIDELPTSPSAVFTSQERIQWYREARKAHRGDPEAAKAAYAAKLQEEMNIRRLVDRQTVHEELVDLSKRWRGDFTAKNRYRNDPRELYADAFSALINDPELLKARAPTFHSLFFNHLDAKPGVRDAYEEMQERAGVSPEEIAEHRADRELAMARRGGEARSDQIQAASQPEQITADKVVGGLARGFIDKARLLYKFRRTLTKAGGAGLAAVRRAINAFEGRNFRDAQQVALTAKIDEHVVTPMLKPFEGNQDDAITALGAYMKARRAAHERAHLANPLGIGGKFAGEEPAGAMTGLRRRLGAERYRAVEAAAAKYWEIRKPLVDRFVAQNTEAPEVAEKMRNNDEYARYQSLKAIESAIQEGGVRAESLGLLDFHKQVGSLGPIGNAFIETVLTDMALVSSAAHAESVNSVRALLSEHFPANILPADTGRGGRPRAGSAPAGYDMLLFRQGGKVQGAYVPAELVDMFKSAPEDLSQALRMWNKAVQTPLRAVLVTHNPYWAYWNAHKDIRTNAKNIYKGHWSLLRAGRDFAKATWDIQRAKGNYIPDELRGMDLGAILPRHRRAWTESDPADVWGALTATRGLLGPAADSVGMLRRGLRKVNRGLQHFGEVTERAGKVAALRESERQGLSPEEVAYNVRNLSGTPNTRRAGSMGRITNAIYLFSGVSKEGIRASYEVARRDPLSWGLKTMLYDFAPKAVMAAAARGLMGEKWKELMDGIPESDKRNYICIPLGFTENGKTMYIPLPLDHAGAAVGSVAWKVLSGQLSSGDLAELVLTNTPWGSSSFNPVLKTVGMGAVYASGRNPNDEFRGRPIMPDKVFRAGGWRARKELAKAAARQLGLGNVFNLSPGRTPPNAGAIERALGTHFVGSGLGRLVRVSDYGLEEKARKVLETGRTEKDKADLAMDDIARSALDNKTTATAAFGEAKEAGKLKEADRAKFMRHYLKIKAREYLTTKDRIESGARTKAERKAIADIIEPEPEPEEDQEEPEDQEEEE